ncbi:hypothetical protein N2601_08790 [Rhizobium sp. CB3060]|uniref:hypothetical protein n=1 Tax=Rhizobium sp. CB3060 TaxID=3138255 RepID=UPI0021A4A3BE|nr:hypothetical protein [Rhizobium tropici]UWU23024.1 hypothetical protein N2601_08790 [Rhizobium tropici]
MKQPATFNQISQLLMDAWISSPDDLGSPEDIYGAVHGMLRPSMILVAVDASSRDTWDFRIDFVQSYRLPSGFADIGLLQQSSSFADFPDQKYLHEVVGSDLCHRRRATTPGHGTCRGSNPRHACSL